MRTQIVSLGVLYIKGIHFERNVNKFTKIAFGNSKAVLKSSVEENIYHSVVMNHRRGVMFCAQNAVSLYMKWLV